MGSGQSPVFSLLNDTFDQLDGAVGLASLRVKPGQNRQRRIEFGKRLRLGGFTIADHCFIRFSRTLNVNVGQSH